MTPDDQFAGLGGNNNDRGYLTARSGPLIVQAAPETPAHWFPTSQASAGDLDLLKYWRFVQKHWRVVVASVVAALMVGLAVTLLMQPIYTASTTVQIDRESAKVLNVEGVEPSDKIVSSEEFFQTQYGLLKSRSLANRVVENQRLSTDERFLTAMKIDPTLPAAQRKKMAIGALSANLGISPVRGSRLVKLTFDSPDPQLSATVANAVADNFIKSNLDRRFESSAYAREFLEGRLASLKQRLAESEKQLVAYAASQQIINVSEAAGTAERPGSAQSLTAASLVAINSSLSAATSERVRAEQRWRQSQSGNGRSIPEVLESPTIQQLSRSRAELMASYQEKLSVYKPDFPAMLQLKAQIAETDRQIASEISNIRGSLDAQYRVALNQERALQANVSQLKSSVLDLRNRSIDYNILQREVDTNRTLYDGLLQRYKEIGVAGGIGSNNVSIIDRAEPPTRPSKPRPLVNLALAALIGLVVGGLLAFILDMLDESVKTPEDVENKLGLPLLGSTPILEKGVTPREALADIRSPFSEAYYSLRTAIQFSTRDGVPSSLLITSARPSEGKSTSSSTLAQNFARLGRRVLLVDADLRNPSLHVVMGTDNSNGFSNVLTGAQTIRDVAQRTEIENLMFIPCGPLPPNPAELLAGGSLRAFLLAAREDFDLVVLDGPPVMGLADAPLLASVAGGTILVVEAAKTRQRLVRAAVERLASAQAKFIGVVLTKFDVRKTANGISYGYDYTYNSNTVPARKT